MINSSQTDALADYHYGYAVALTISLEDCPEVESTSTLFNK